MISIDKALAMLIGLLTKISQKSTYGSRMTLSSNIFPPLLCLSVSYSLSFTYFFLILSQGLPQHGVRFSTFSLSVHHGASAVLSEEEFSLSAIMN